MTSSSDEPIPSLPLHCGKKASRRQHAEVTLSPRKTDAVEVFAQRDREFPRASKQVANFGDRQTCSHLQPLRYSLPQLDIGFSGEKQIF